MAWNSGPPETTSLSLPEKKVLTVGAPVAYNPGTAGKPYHDGWDIERAYKEGVARITWVYRAIDAIAGNQSKLPIIFRKDDANTGEIIKGGRKNKDVYKVLNSIANVGESSFAFRYRVSFQLLISTRGVFIEVIKTNDGSIESVHLLPPQSTSPVPHPTKFVSHYEVEMPDGKIKKLKPENVIWIRRPHPLDPYRSITPLEAAGIAIEVEQLAKIYNRNFLINDGRPGGLIVLRGEIDPIDREELESRFRGNIRKTGMVSVISSDDGADFVDTGSSPRDMAYRDMRSITKEEILAAFGVPESIIGNASGRTFSNAAEEGKVFWNETMEPHLLLLARGLDALPQDEETYIDFDKEAVPILVLARQERERHSLNEFQGGLISANEYRDHTGRKTVVSELSDALLANPNLTPIGNTEKDTPPPVDPNQQGLPLDVQDGSVEVVDSSQDPSLFGEEEGAPALAPGVNAEDAASTNTPAGTGAGGVAVASGRPEDYETKDYDEGLETKALQDIERWEKTIAKALSRFFDRQQRVVTEKAGSKKVRRQLESGEVDIDVVFDSKVWNKQLGEDLRPIVEAIFEDAADAVEQRSGQKIDRDAEGYKKLIDQQIKRAERLNETTKEEVGTALFIAAALVGATVAEKANFLNLTVGAIYVDIDDKRKDQIAENEAFTAYNGSLWETARQVKAPTKTWLSRKDDKVRATHKLLHGKTVPLGTAFKAAGIEIRFPGDPAAPGQHTIGCRCILGFKLA